MIAICALVTSIASIYLTISQGDDMQRLVQAQSWPFLGMSTGNTSKNEITGLHEPVITLELENLGVGPAKIQTLELSYDGKPVTSSYELLRTCCMDATDGERVPGTEQSPILTSPVVNRVLRAGQTTTLFRWARPTEDDRAWNRLNKARFVLKHKICYCSVFDECWTSDLETTNATPVAACPAVDKQYRE
ncbi:hypothetical protein [Arenimonas sp.]|uniref:hypothetical protein n=1 Tax=Arenimonas sp. TaxID=1872635 RepID=UPI0039E2F235